MSTKVSVVAAVALISISGVWLTGCGGGDTGAGDQNLVGSSANPTAVDVRNLRSLPLLPLSVPDPTFTAGSWGPGIIYKATGFAPGSPVSLYIETQQSSTQHSQQSFDVYADSAGNLSSAWSPSELPQAPATSGYPKYVVFAFQASNDTTPPKVTNDVALTITS